MMIIITSNANAFANSMEQKIIYMVLEKGNEGVYGWEAKKTTNAMDIMMQTIPTIINKLTLTFAFYLAFRH